jgi:glyoxylase-like metal-dependent hydrolase (beta-lactamase superfamily II)
MLEDDPFDYGTPKSIAGIKVDGNEEFNIDGFKFKYHLFAGHTPGCSIIEIEDCLFSGDFIFSGSIGRVDFPYSNPEDMKNSLNRILNWEKDFKVYTGHGESTSLFKEKNSLTSWLNYI